MCDEVRLRAKVKEVLSPSNNYIGTIVDGLPVPVTKLPEPDWLEISGEYGGFFVFYLDAALVCFADSWHCRAGMGARRFIERFDARLFNRDSSERPPVAARPGHVAVRVSRATRRLAANLPDPFSQAWQNSARSTSPAISGVRRIDAKYRANAW
jgi:hypothetical protein